jgi:hypothetical protein
MRRYYKEILNYDARLDTLTHLTRAWLEMTNRENIETWIAHGTLLGWWWNAKVRLKCAASRFQSPKKLIPVRQLLPWDWDVDVQVHTDTLQMLGEKYNQTFHHYSSNDKSVNREYLLDVNAWAWERVRGDGNNIIDARWIDVRNGLYIDITGIAETNHVEEPGILKCKNGHKYQVSSHPRRRRSSLVLITDPRSMTRFTRYAIPFTKATRRKSLTRSTTSSLRSMVPNRW